MLTICRSRKQFYSIVTTFLVLVAVHGQHTEENTLPVLVFVQELETQFNIKFSFADRDISDVRIPKVALDKLEAYLEYLQAQTGLQVQTISNRYYALVKNPQVDICGLILDNFEKNTIPGATLEVLNTEVTTTTDNQGRFSLKNIPRNASLKIRFLGYETQYLPVESLLTAECPKILMSLYEEPLPEVVVYTFLTEGITKLDDGSTQISTANFGIIPGLIEPDVLQTIQSLPGIKSIDETVSDINVRGGTNDQNLVLWNGIKMYQSGHFFGLISAFNPYLTKKTTVFKNGTPSRYGDGISSVIRIDTENDISNRFSGGAGFNLISGDIFGQIPLSEKLAVQLSGRRSSTDFLDTPTFNQFFDRALQDSEIRNSDNLLINENIERNEEFFFFDITGKILYDINDIHKLRVNLIRFSNLLDFSQTNLEDNTSTQSRLGQSNFSVGTQLNSKWSERFSTYVNTYFTQYQLDSESNFANGIQRLAQTNTVEERFLRLESNYKLNDFWQSNLGYQYTETGITNTTDVSQPQFFSNIKGIVRNHAPYIDVNYKSENQKLEVTAGTRVNYIQNPDTFTRLLVEPRLHLRYQLHPNLQLQVQGEFKSQTTNQIIDLEQNFLGIENRRWIISDNDELPITQSRQGSAGFIYDRNNLYIGLEGFYKQVDGVSTRTQGFQNQNQFDGEIGGYTVNGIEFLINKKETNYSLWLSYTFNDNTYIFNSIIPSSFPNNLDIRHTITAAGTYTINRLKLGIGINYRTGPPFTQPLAGDLGLDTTLFPPEINFENPNSRRLPDFYRIDASAIYPFQLGQNLRATAGISVLNITNRRNTLDRFFRVTTENEIESVGDISLGITPNISFRVKF